MAPAFVASVMLAADARAAGVDPTQASAAQKTDAQAHFNKAREAFAGKKLDAALAEFRASFDIVASPNARLQIARTLREMGKLAEAWSEYDRTAADAKDLAAKEARYGATADAAAQERGDVETKIGLLTVTVDHPAEGTTLTVDGNDVARAVWARPQAVMPATIDIVVWTGGKEVARQSVSVSAGEKKAVTLDAEPPKPATVATAQPLVLHEIAKDDLPPTDKPIALAPSPGPTKLRPYAYVAGGLGIVGLATFGVFGAMEKSTHSTLVDACGNAPCPPGHENDISTGKTQQTVANIGLVVGIVGVATGVVLFIVSRPPSGVTTGGTAIVVGPSFIGLRGAL